MDMNSLKRQGFLEKKIEDEEIHLISFSMFIY